MHQIDAVTSDRSLLQVAKPKKGRLFLGGKQVVLEPSAGGCRLISKYARRERKMSNWSRNEKHSRGIQVKHDAVSMLSTVLQARHHG